MAANIDIAVTDLTGYNFIVKLNWDIDCMKKSISAHYEMKLFNDFLKTGTRAERQCREARDNNYVGLKSPLRISQNNYDFENIALIYNDKIIEQNHVKHGLFTLEMMDNNILSFVIVKKRTY